MELIFENTLDGVLTSADDVRLRDELGTYAILNDDSGLPALPPTNALTASPAGVYAYSPALPAGTYTASWQVTNGGRVDYYAQSFVIAEDDTLLSGVRLLEIEQELARRIGTYDEVEVADGTLSSLTVAELKSSIASNEDVTDVYLLRRGLLRGGAAVPSFDPDDRIRAVSSIEPETGTIRVDQAWAVSPVAGELIEFHFLHPRRELRAAVLRGLRRAYILDRVSVAWTGNAAELDLTTSLSWLRHPSQVRRVQWLPTGGIVLPTAVRWTAPILVGGNVTLQLSGAYAGDLYLTVLRPADTLVNGATCLIGPNDDQDILAVDLDYAVAAAHIEAWRIGALRPKLQAQALGGAGISQAEAAREFSERARLLVPRSPGSIHFREPFGYLGAGEP